MVKTKKIAGKKFNFKVPKLWFKILPKKKVIKVGNFTRKNSNHPQSNCLKLISYEKYKSGLTIKLLYIKSVYPLFSKNF